MNGSFELKLKLTLRGLVSDFDFDFDVNTYACSTTVNILVFSCYTRV